MTEFLWNWMKCYSLKNCFIAILIDSNLHVSSILRSTEKSLYFVPGFYFKDLNLWNKQGYLFLFVADIYNPIPIILKLWESQADMGLLFFFF